MNTKNLIIALVVLVLLAGAGYFAYTKYGMAPAETPPATSDDVVQAQDVTVGTGTEATPNSIVSLLYVGRLADGTVFDSSEAHNNEPLRFQLGVPTIIPGFQIGVNGMREGGERRIAIPPSLGYGSADFIDPTTGNVVVPANSTLVFDVKLLKVEPAPTGTSTPQAQ